VLDNCKNFTGAFCLKPKYLAFHDSLAFRKQMALNETGWEPVAGCGLRVLADRGVPVAPRLEEGAGTAPRQCSGR